MSYYVFGGGVITFENSVDTNSKKFKRTLDLLSEARTEAYFEKNNRCYNGDTVIFISDEDFNENVLESALKAAAGIPEIKSGYILYDDSYNEHWRYYYSHGQFIRQAGEITYSNADEGIPMIYLNDTTEEQIDKALAYIGDSEDNKLLEIFQTEFSTDGDQKDADVLRTYKQATIEQRACLDKLLVGLCGWTMGTLIKKMLGEEEGDQDV